MERTTWFASIRSASPRKAISNIARIMVSPNLGSLKIEQSWCSSFQQRLRSTISAILPEFALTCILYYFASQSSLTNCLSVSSVTLHFETAGIPKWKYLKYTNELFLKIRLSHCILHFPNLSLSSAHSTPSTLKRVCSHFRERSDRFEPYLVHTLSRTSRGMEPLQRLCLCSRWRWGRDGDMKAERWEGNKVAVRKEKDKTVIEQLFGSSGYRLMNLLTLCESIHAHTHKTNNETQTHTNTHTFTHTNIQIQI